MTEIRATVLIFSVIVLAMVPLTIVLVRMRRSITSSLSNLSKGAAIIGSGNLDFQIEEKRGDEIGDLARAFNAMAVSLRETTASKADLEREIKERGLAEEMLKDSERRLAEAQRTAHIGSWEWDLNTGEMHWSDEMYRSTGVTPQSFTPTLETAIQKIHPDDRQKAREQLNEILARGTGTYEHRIVLPDGSIRDVLTNSVVTYEESGKPESLTGTLQDITERKKAIEALRESEERFSKAFHTSPVAMTIARLPEGRWVDVNNSFLLMMEYTREEVIGHTSAELNMFPDPDKRAEVLRVFSEKGRVQNQELTVRTKTGKLGTVLSSNEKVSLNGQDHAISIMLDITERKKAEKVKDEFIGMVSHEIKTPLTVIMGALNTINAKGLSEKESQELLQDAITGSDSLAGIVENLLELSRSQANRLVLYAEHADIGQIARNVVQKLQSKSAIHRLNIDWPEGLPAVVVDPVRVERILFNLVENAIKYSSKGGEVKVSARRENKDLVVCVSDRGPGISPDDQKKLFQSFEQLVVNNRRAMQGIGLGLKVCRTLVEAHGGRIWVESQPGKGSSFYFTVPVEGISQLH